MSNMPFILNFRNIDYIYEQIKFYSKFLKLDFELEYEADDKCSPAEVALIIELTNLKIDPLKQEMNQIVKKINQALNENNKIKLILTKFSSDNEQKKENAIEDFLRKIDSKKSKFEMITVEEDWVYEFLILSSQFHEFELALSKIKINRETFLLRDAAETYVTVFLQHLSEVSRALKKEKSARHAYSASYGLIEEKIKPEKKLRPFSAEYGYLYRLIEVLKKNILDEIVELLVKDNLENKKLLINLQKKQYKSIEDEHIHVKIASNKMKVLFLISLFRDLKSGHKIKTTINEYNAFEKREKEIKLGSAVVTAERQFVSRGGFVNLVKKFIVGIFHCIKNCFSSKKNNIERPNSKLIHASSYARDCNVFFEKSVASLSSTCIAKKRVEDEDLKPEPKYLKTEKLDCDIDNDRRALAPLSL